MRAASTACSRTCWNCRMVFSSCCPKIFMSSLLWYAVMAAQSEGLDSSLSSFVEAFRSLRPLLSIGDHLLTNADRDRRRSIVVPGTTIGLLLVLPGAIEPAVGGTLLRRGLHDRAD